MKTVDSDLWKCGKIQWWPISKHHSPIYLEQQHKIIVGSEQAAIWQRIESGLFHIRRSNADCSSKTFGPISTATYNAEWKKRTFSFHVCSFIPVDCWRRNSKTNCQLLEAEFWHQESKRKYNLYVAVHCRWEVRLIRLLIDDTFSTATCKTYAYRAEWSSLIISNGKYGRIYEREDMVYFLANN